MHWQQICETLKTNQDQAQTCSYDHMNSLRSVFYSCLLLLDWPGLGCQMSLKAKMIANDCCCAGMVADVRLGWNSVLARCVA